MTSSEVEVALSCTLHILHSLYDLKQTAKDWHECCVSELIKQGFYESNTDLCLLIHTDRRIMLLLYMNDIVVASPTLFNMLWFKNVLVKAFKVKNLRETQNILSIQIICDCKQRTLHMNQTYYVDKILWDLHIRLNKHKYTEISLNEYDALHPVNLNN